MTVKYDHSANADQSAEAVHAIIQEKIEAGDIIAPPTFMTTFRDGADSGTFLRELGTDISRVLHGEQEFELYRPIRPGEMNGVMRPIISR